MRALFLILSYELIFLPPGTGSAPPPPSTTVGSTGGAIVGGASVPVGG